MKLSILFKNEWTISVVAALLYIPFLGHVHLFDWDEINFAENAREMITSGNYFSVQMNS
jgi:4-amino-4-deoxy-L-arabinose transferase-like glycosyltransferase